MIDDPAVRCISIALIHHPVLDRDQNVVTTAITNLDIHDLSRTARTYGIQNVFIVHPVAAQRELAERVQAHWVEGAGGRRIPDRKEALALIRVVPLLVDAITQIVSQVGAEPELWATGAVSQGDVKSYVELRQRLRTVGPPVMLLYGTGWGLAPSVFQQATLRIHPIEGVNAWNHLSVRAACAIMLDRLCGLCLP